MAAMCSMSVTNEVAAYIREGATSLFEFSLSITHLSYSHSELVRKHRVDPTLKKYPQVLKIGTKNKGLVWKWELFIPLLTINQVS